MATREIWKFDLRKNLNTSGDGVALELPQGAIVRHFAPQGDGLMIWVEVDPFELVKIRRLFSVVGTGWQFDSGGVYLGTTIDGSFVWHLYELRS